MSLFSRRGDNIDPSVTPENHYLRARATSGEGDIPAGRVVRVVGVEADGTWLIRRASPDGFNDWWITHARISDGQVGVVYRTHTLTGLDTSAASGINASVFLGEDGEWSLTSVPADTTLLRVRIGRVTVKDATAGEIAILLPPVYVQFGTEALRDDAVTSDKILTGAVTPEKLSIPFRNGSGDPLPAGSVVVVTGVSTDDPPLPKGRLWHGDYDGTSESLWVLREDLADGALGRAYKTHTIIRDTSAAGVGYRVMLQADGSLVFTTLAPDDPLIESIWVGRVLTVDVAGTIEINLVTYLNRIMGALQIRDALQPHHRALRCTLNLNGDPTRGAGTILVAGSWDEPNQCPMLFPASGYGYLRQLWVLREQGVDGAQAIAYKTYRLEGVDTSGGGVGDDVFLDPDNWGGWTLSPSAGVGQSYYITGRIAVADAVVGAIEFNLDLMFAKAGVNGFRTDVFHLDVIAGDAAGDHTLVGVTADSEITKIIYTPGVTVPGVGIVAGLPQNLTAEFTASDVDTINNTGGTDTTGGTLTVHWIAWGLA